MDSVLLPAQLALQDNSDIMESAMPLAHSELALKEVTVKELVQLELGPTIVDATELAQLNSLLMMLASKLAQQEPLFRTVFASHQPKLAQLEVSSMPHHLHAEAATSLVQPVH